MVSSQPNSPPDPSPIDELIEKAVADTPAAERRTARRLLTEAFGLITDRPDELDLKIATAALTEMRDAFEMFEPFADVPKVTIFGSARTRADDPLYHQTEQVAAGLAAQGWMVVTGAGPGIMEAGMRGAGRANSIGVSIRLPFESGANSVIAGDDKHVSMKYFFTRKLMLVKESAGFVCMPGGFGTLDETFELLTLTQTGKGVPVPIVFHDVAADDHGPSYWGSVDTFVRTVLIPRGLVSPDDLHLYRLSDDPADTVAEITGFYANYHSIRFVDDRLVIRLRRAPDDAQLAALNRDFDDLKIGDITVVEPSAVERAERDHVDLDRLELSFNRRGFAELRALIDRINTW